MWGIGRRSMPGLMLAATAMVPAARAATPKPHRLILHVDQNDADVMDESLWNLLNAIEYYASRHEALAVELVANGAGYAMMRDTSPAKARIASIHKQYPTVVFSACQKARAGAAQREGKTIDQIIQLPEATSVPAGVARLVELQEQGFSYVKV